MSSQGHVEEEGGDLSGLVSFKVEDAIMFEASHEAEEVMGRDKASSMVDRTLSAIGPKAELVNLVTHILSGDFDKDNVLGVDEDSFSKSDSKWVQNISRSIVLVELALRQKDTLLEFEILVESHGVSWKDVAETVTRLVPGAIKELPPLPPGLQPAKVAEVIPKEPQDQGAIPALRAAAALRSKFLQDDGRGLFSSPGLRKEFVEVGDTYFLREDMDQDLDNEDESMDIVDEDRESKGRQKEDEKARESAPGIELHDEIEETNSSAGEKLLDMSMNTEISVERMSDKTDDTFSHIGLAPAREVGHPQNSAHRRQEEEEEEEEERTVADCEGNVFRVVQPQPTSTQTSTTTATNREASTRTRRRRIWSWKHLQLLINLAFGIAVPVLIRTARTQWITAPINGTPSSVPVLIGVTVALEFCLMPTMLAIIYSKFLSRLPESRNEDYIPSWTAMLMMVELYSLGLMHLGAAAGLCEPLISFPLGVEGYDMSLLYFLCVFVGLVGLIQSAVAMGIVAGIDMFKGSLLHFSTTFIPGNILYVLVFTMIGYGIVNF